MNQTDLCLYLHAFDHVDMNLRDKISSFANFRGLKGWRLPEGWHLSEGGAHFKGKLTRTITVLDYSDITFTNN